MPGWLIIGQMAIRLLVQVTINGKIFFHDVRKEIRNYLCVIFPLCNNAGNGARETGMS